MTLGSEQKEDGAEQTWAGQGARAKDRACAQDLGARPRSRCQETPSSVSTYTQLTQHTLPSPGDKGGLPNHRPVEVARSGQEAARSRAHAQLGSASLQLGPRLTQPGTDQRRPCVWAQGCAPPRPQQGINVPEQGGGREPPGLSHITLSQISTPRAACLRAAEPSPWERACHLCPQRATWTGWPTGPGAERPFQGE